jgi:hypothetical protein
MQSKTKTDYLIRTAHLTKGMSQTHNSQHIAVIGGH